MSFTPDWLALRRSADARARARSGTLTQALARHLASRPAPIRVLDLGAGTGANLDWLAPRLRCPQHWRLVDNDARLLSRVTVPEGVEVETLVADLAGDLKPLFDPPPDLLTASAFFDLVGAGIVQEIADHTASANAAFLTVLTYDGDQQWAPPHPADDGVVAAFNGDQQTDKGLGPALGPAATSHLAAAFRRRGYSVRTASTPWRLAAPHDAPLITQLATGTAQAAEHELGETASEWGRVRSKARTVRIGHRDLLALPGRP